MLLIGHNLNLYEPALYWSTGSTNALYKRNRIRLLTCCLRNQRDHMDCQHTVDVSFDVCAFCFVDIVIQEPLAQCSWRDLADFAQVLMVG